MEHTPAEDERQDHRDHKSKCANFPPSASLARSRRRRPGSVNNPKDWYVATYHNDERDGVRSNHKRDRVGSYTVQRCQIREYN